MGDFNRISRELTALSAKELEQIRARTTVLLGFKEPTDDINADWLLIGLLTALKSRGQYTAPLRGISHMRSYRGYSRRAPAIRLWIEQQTLGLSRVERIGFGVVLARAYLDYLDKWPGATLANALNLIERLPEAIERSFPGYLKNGWLKMLVQHGR